MMRIRPRRRNAPRIGIAPLVDCVFLLLIFFLLTSTTARDRGLEIQLPAAATAESPREDLLRVAISEAGEIALNGRTIPLDELAASIAEQFSRGGRRPVLLVADRRLPLEKVTRVIDELRRARVGALVLATRSDPRRVEGGR
ncbi:MAG: biopolymer transporter ExbD [Candidatus Brocadiia bacterium]